MISVIIPVYNAEHSLQGIIESVEAQSYQDFEVVLINDGSTDKSGIICDAIAKKDQRFLVLHQNNKGVSISRNNGMSVASGEYITFLDSDDDIPINYLDVLNRVQSKTNADIVICDVAIIHNNTEIGRFSLKKPELEQNQALDYVLSRERINSGPCGKLFRKKLIQDMRFPSLKAYEDIIFVVEAFDKAKIIVATNQTEYMYIQNDTGAMSSFSKKPSTDIIIATETLIEHIEKRTDLSPKCMYTAFSHLYQYVQSIRSDVDSEDFVCQVRSLFARYRRLIINCSAFSWKEKIYYILFSCGLIK